MSEVRSFGAMIDFPHPRDVMMRFAKPKFNASLGLRPRHYSELALACQEHRSLSESALHLIDQCPPEWCDLTASYLASREMLMDKEYQWQKFGWVNDAVIEARKRYSETAVCA